MISNIIDKAVELDVWFIFANSCVHLNISSLTEWFGGGGGELEDENEKDLDRIISLTLTDESHGMKRCVLHSDDNIKYAQFQASTLTLAW